MEEECQAQAAKSTHERPKSTTLLMSAYVTRIFPDACLPENNQLRLHGSWERPRLCCLWPRNGSKLGSCLTLPSSLPGTFPIGPFPNFLASKRKGEEEYIPNYVRVTEHLRAKSWLAFMVLVSCLDFLDGPTIPHLKSLQ